MQGGIGGTCPPCKKKFKKKRKRKRKERRRGGREGRERELMLAVA